MSLKRRSTLAAAARARSRNLTQEAVAASALRARRKRPVPKRPRCSADLGNGADRRHGQTGQPLYIEDGSAIAKEFYLALLVDRATSEVAFVVSTEGGTSIEDVAHKTPEKIVSFGIDPATGIMPHHGRAIAAALKLSGAAAKQAVSLAEKLYTPSSPTTCRCLRSIH